ncbi:MAG: hypothetical protein KC442_19675 [Thermomicrobiales bacterium]|nr:hypothetical protein [Thermomicrobiales bacterium]
MSGAHDFADLAQELAMEVAPAEAILAPGVVDAYLAGGRSQRDLFAKTTNEYGGFGGLGLTTLFPSIVGAIALAGPAILAVLNSTTVKDGVGVLQTLLKLREANSKATPDDAAPAPAALLAAASALTAELDKLGVDTEKRDAIAYRTLIVLLSRPAAATPLVTALASAGDQ